MMVLWHPRLLNAKSISECCEVFEEALNLCPGCLGQIRLRGTRTIFPLMLENDRRRERLLAFFFCGSRDWLVFTADNLIRE
jgi:hypothetical protein